jgi:hypothetical protein
MGRGRQKAKHTKVARELKYFSPNTNYGALERELTHASGSEPEYIDKWGDDDAEDSSSDGAGITHESDAFGGSASSGFSPDYGVDQYDDYDGDEAEEPHSRTA